MKGNGEFYYRVHFSKENNTTATTTDDDETTTSKESKRKERKRIFFHFFISFINHIRCCNFQVDEYLISSSNRRKTSENYIGNKRKHEEK